MRADRVLQDGTSSDTTSAGATFCPSHQGFQVRDGIQQDLELYG
jgi:hypothetical protein